MSDGAMKRFDSLLVGERYRVMVNDCCVNAVVRGRFIGYGPDHEATFDEEADDNDAVFDFGRLGPHWGPMEFHVIEDES